MQRLLPMPGLVSALAVGRAKSTRLFDTRQEEGQEFGGDKKASA